MPYNFWLSEGSTFGIVTVATPDISLKWGGGGVRFEKQSYPLCLKLSGGGGGGELAFHASKFSAIKGRKAP